MYGIIALTVIYLQHNVKWGR